MKKATLLKYLKELIVTLIIVTIIASVLSYIRAPKVEGSAPSLKGLSINNEPIDLKALHKPFILHFWATWCPVCKMEADNIDRLSDNFEVISVAVKSGTNEEIKTFLDKHNYHYKVINDASSTFASFMKVEAFPTTFFYNAKGELVLTEVGYTSTFGLYMRMLFINYFL